MTLHLLLPASVVKEGVVIGETGQRLRYKLNGFRVFVTTVIALGVGMYLDIVQLASISHAKFLSLLTAGCAVWRLC